MLSLCSNVIENGVQRFLRKLSKKAFDEEDLVLRTKELKLVWKNIQLNTDADKIGKCVSTCIRN